ncbi:hypothetical protein [Butyricimonas sp. Marseille-P3923]|uniref:hypothetical protein n=1 Tax=Butyricimonas sp. Marseille-P3923 TaxID=1987504 RepID=UPI000C07BB25|nr:hypothetical protein [Butyricimonas sp. Marseille-P3923]
MSDCIAEKVIIQVEKDIKNKNFDKALCKLRIVYFLKSFSVDFGNKSIDVILKKISNMLFPKEMEYEPIKNNYVFCDSLSWDNHGITQQYIRALMAMGANILYIRTQDTSKKAWHTQIYKELQLYPNSQISEIPKNRKFSEHAKLIYQWIKDFKPEKIFLHSSFSLADVLVLYKINIIDKYRINLGDHQYWPGIDCTNYIIEFRNWGYTLSFQRRFFNKANIFKLPYYPIIDENDFEGFPSHIKKDTVLMFTGCRMYKVMDKDYTFFYIMKRLLIANPALVILFAARDNNSVLKKFVIANKLQERLILLEYRRDINEVFRHVDLFLQTYPIGGGLMRDYAISNKKAVLAYTSTEKLENDLNIDDRHLGDEFGEYRLAYDNLDDFYREAGKLINDRIYREYIGACLNKYLMTQERFDVGLKQIVQAKQQPQDILLQEVFIDYELLEKRYCIFRKREIMSYYLLIIKEFKLRTFYLFPKIIPYLPKMFVRLGRNILNKYH